MVKSAHVNSAACLFEFLVVFVEVDIRGSVGDNTHSELINSFLPQELIVTGRSGVEVPIYDTVLEV